MTPSNANIFRVSGPLWGEFGVLFTKAIDAELWCFICYEPEHTIEQTMETPVIWDAIELIMTSLLCKWLPNLGQYVSCPVDCLLPSLSVVQVTRMGYGHLRAMYCTHGFISYIEKNLYLPLSWPKSHWMPAADWCDILWDRRQINVLFMRLLGSIMFENSPHVCPDPFTKIEKRHS